MILAIFLLAGAILFWGIWVYVSESNSDPKPTPADPPANPPGDDPEKGVQVKEEIEPSLTEPTVEKK